MSRALRRDRAHRLMRASTATRSCRNGTGSGARRPIRDDDSPRSLLKNARSPWIDAFYEASPRTNRASRRRAVSCDRVGDVSARPSCGHRHERDQSTDIEGRAREAEEPVHLRESTQFHLPHPGDRFQPAKRGLDPRPGVQAFRVAVMARRPCVDGTAATAIHVLRHMRCDVERPQDVDQAVRVS